MNIITPFNWPQLPDAMTDEQYRSLPGVAHSDLQSCWINPEQLMHKRMYGDTPSEAQSFGTAFDIALLRPQLFDSTFYVLSDAEVIAKIGGAKPRATNAYKAWLEEQQAAANGKYILSADDVSRINSMIMSVHRSFPWLDTSPTQVVFQGVDDMLGQTKALVDIPYAIHNGTTYRIDVKTTGTDQLNRPYVPMNDGAQHLLDMGYATQGEWYCHFANEPLTFANLMVLKEPPYTAYMLVHTKSLRHEAKVKLEAMKRFYDNCFDQQGNSRQLPLMLGA